MNKQNHFYNVILYYTNGNYKIVESTSSELAIVTHWAKEIAYNYPNSIEFVAVTDNYTNEIVFSLAVK